MVTSATLLCGKFSAEQRRAFDGASRLASAILISAMFLQPADGFGQQKPVDGRRAELPFFDPQAMFETFLGSNRPNDHEELSKIAVTPQEEREYGMKVLASFHEDFRRRKIVLKTKGRDVEYLQKLVNRLQPAMQQAERYPRIEVLVAESDTTDAYSIPGGTLIVYRGMLELAGSEAALVGVLGHELSHLDRQHQLLPVRRMKAARQNFQSFDPASMVRQANLFMSAFTKPFRPEDEQQADDDSVAWMYKAGYDPRQLSQLFARLHQLNQTDRFMPSFLRTHPFHADRQAAVDRKLAELQAADPRDDLYVGRQNLIRRIPLSENRFPER